MIELKRILLTTDLSEYADEAKRYACAFAERFGAELHVLHVIHDPRTEVPDFGMGLAFPGFVENLAEHRADAEQGTLAELGRQLDPEWTTRHQTILSIRFGPPFVEIIRYAREHAVGLIVMATHGRSGLGHVLIGSVAEKVVRKAPCPVMTIRPRQWVDELEPAREAQALRPATAD